MLVLVSVVYTLQSATRSTNSIPEPGQNLGNFKNGEKIVTPIFTMLNL
jgi:hypothetical protein